MPSICSWLPHAPLQQDCVCVCVSSYVCIIVFVCVCVMKKEKESKRESHSNVTERWFSKAPALHSRLWASLKFYRRSARPRSIYENALPRFMENTSQRGVDGVIWKRVELTASTAYSYRLPSLLGGLCARSIVCWRGTVNRMDHFPVVLMFITSPGAEWDWVAYFQVLLHWDPYLKQM